MTSSIPFWIWLVVLAVPPTVILFLSAQMFRSSPATGLRRAALLGGTLALWFALIFVLAATGALRGRASAPPVIGLPILLAISGGLLALGRSRRLRAILAVIPRHALVAIQTLRMVGAVFVVLAARGALPRHFAYPAGLGDFAVGLAAPAVAYALARGSRGSRIAALVWNVLGLVDLATAVALGALSADSPIRLFTGGPSIDPMASLPLALIPAFAVPLFALVHVASILQLRRSTIRASSRRAFPARGLRTA